MPKQPKSEVEAYDHIRSRLRILNWNVRNPSTRPDGQVWTQHQCHGHPFIKAALGRDTPENIVKLSEDKLWIIEAKAHRANLDQAVEEATSKYAKAINDHPNDLEAILAIGIAGDEDSGYIARTLVRIDKEWHIVTIND